MIFNTLFRILLQKIPLPGESQSIDKLIDAFANEYYKQNSSSPVFAGAG